MLQIELLAVYHALKNYEHYCRHRVVHIFCDNISLVYLKGMAAGSPREQRLASFLMNFRLIFHHVSGKRENMLADSLSRCFEEMNATELEEWIPNVDPKDDFLFTITQTDNEDSQIQTAKVKDAHVTVRPTTVTTDIPAMQPGTCWQCHSVTFQNVDSGSEPGLDVINTTQCAYSSENHLFTDTNIKVSNASQPITQLHDCTTGASPGYSNILLSSSGSHVLSKQLVHSDNGSVAPPHNSTLE